MSIGIHVVLLVVLFVMSAFFAASETALFSLSKLDKRRLKETHPHLCAWVMDHLDHPRRTLITILIGNMTVHILATAIATLIALELWGPHSLALVMILFTLLVIFVGEILPKSLAVRMAELISIAIAMPLKIFSVAIFPLIKITNYVSERLVKMMVREAVESSDKVSEDELKTLVKIGEEQGVLDQQERYMIHKLFELGERDVKEIMTPRVDLVALDIDDSVEENIQKLKQYHYSHFPVYKDSPDHILGVLSVQDYMLDLEKGMQGFLKEPFFVPESKRIDDLLKEFREKGEKFAICVDEYGGTAGLVTLEDILEEIFGEFYDEYAKVENPIRQRGHGDYIVEAKISLTDLNSYFSTNLEAQEASTLGGFILEKLGEVPKKGHILATDDFEITIGDVIGHRRIHNVILRKKS